MLSSICFFFFTAVLSASDEHEYVQYRAHGTHARTFCSRGCAWAFNSTVDHGNCEPKWRGLIKHLGRYDFLGGDIYRRSLKTNYLFVLEWTPELVGTNTEPQMPAGQVLRGTRALQKLKCTTRSDPESRHRSEIASCAQQDGKRMAPRLKQAIGRLVQTESV